MIDDIEYAWLTCWNCESETMLILTRPEDLDACIEELGHTGHKIVIEGEAAEVV